MNYEIHLPNDFPFSEMEVEMLFDNFFILYRKYRGRDHPTMSQMTIQNIIKKLPTDGKTYFKYDDYFPMMKQYFHTEFKGYECDYKLSHFVSGNIRTNRLNELQRNRTTEQKELNDERE